MVEALRRSLLLNVIEIGHLSKRAEARYANRAVRDNPLAPRAQKFEVHLAG